MLKLTMFLIPTKHFAPKCNCKRCMSVRLLGLAALMVPEYFIISGAKRVGGVRGGNSARCAIFARGVSCIVGAGGAKRCYWQWWCGWSEHHSSYALQSFEAQKVFQGGIKTF